MRAVRVALGIAGATLLAAAAPGAEPKPIHGCHAAPTCQPLGFSTLNRNSGDSFVFFGVGMKFGPGFELFVPGMARDIPILVTEPPKPASGEDVIHLRASLLSPEPSSASPLFRFPQPDATAKD